MQFPPYMKTEPLSHFQNFILFLKYNSHTCTEHTQDSLWQFLKNTDLSLILTSKPTSHIFPHTLCVCTEEIWSHLHTI